MCLRDPNGFTKWKGDWSNDSKKWTKETRKALTPGGDGIFWINLDDICNYFTVVSLFPINTVETELIIVNFTHFGAKI